INGRRTLGGPRMKSIALRIAAAQVALAAMIARSGRTIIGVTLLVLIIGRIRRKWLYEWLWRFWWYRLRRRSLPPGGGPATLLGLLRPTAALGSIDVDGVTVGLIEDVHGMSAVIEVGEPTDPFGEPRALETALPA